MPVLKHIHPIRATIINANPDRPVKGIEDIMNILCHSCKFLLINGHCQVSTAAVAMLLCCIVVFKMLEDEVALACVPLAFQTTYKETQVRQ